MSLELVKSILNSFIDTLLRKLRCWALPSDINSGPESFIYFRQINRIPIQNIIEFIWTLSETVAIYPSIL